jgi:hypothetical protein
MYLLDLQFWGENRKIHRPLPILGTEMRKSHVPEKFLASYRMGTDRFYDIRGNHSFRGDLSIDNFFGPLIFIILYNNFQAIFTDVKIQKKIK